MVPHFCECMQVQRCFRQPLAGCAFLLYNIYIGARYECHICRSHYKRGANLTKHLKEKHEFRLPAGQNRLPFSELF